MTIIDLPAAPFHDIELVAVPRLGGGGAQERVSGRISLAPIVWPLSAEQAAARDAQWRDYLIAQSPHSDYSLLDLTCAFRPAADGDPFDDATVGILLESPGADVAPIAWSIAPKNRARPAKSRPEVKITASLGVVQVGADVKPGEAGEEVYVVGMGERDSDPEWRFHATSGHVLIGDEPLTLMVKIPAGLPAYAHVSIAATIKQRRLGLIPYRAELPPELQTIDLRKP